MIEDLRGILSESLFRGLGANVGPRWIYFSSINLVGIGSCSTLSKFMGAAIALFRFKLLEITFSQFEVQS